MTSEHDPRERPLRKHWLQRLMDDPWLLLLLGILVPFLSYTIWGWIELARLSSGLLP